MEEDKKFLSEDSFNYLKEHEPEFLRSYYILVKFYEHMTNDFTHKVWKDGRIVLTPKTLENEEVSD